MPFKVCGLAQLTDIFVLGSKDLDKLIAMITVAGGAGSIYIANVLLHGNQIPPQSILASRDHIVACDQQNFGSLLTIGGGAIHLYSKNNAMLSQVNYSKPPVPASGHMQLPSWSAP